MQDRGFFSSLFDFRFEQFITLRLIKVLYVLSVIAVAIGAIVLLVSGILQGGGQAIASVLLAPLVFLLGLIYVRVLLELIAVAFRIERNTRGHRPPMGEDPAEPAPATPFLPPPLQ